MIFFVHIISKNICVRFTGGLSCRLVAVNPHVCRYLCMRIALLEGRGAKSSSHNHGE